MRYHRADVVDRALEVLDRHGLAALTMRRLGTELGVRPSALYHHFDGKVALLAGLADEMLARGRRPRAVTAWDGRVFEVCLELRDAMLAVRDGADVVATVHALGRAAAEPGHAIEEALVEGGVAPTVARTATSTVLHFVFGHTRDEQTHAQESPAGAADADGDRRRRRDAFDLGLGLILDGIRAQLHRAGQPSGGVDHGTLQLRQEHRSGQVDAGARQTGLGEVDAVQ